MDALEGTMKRLLKLREVAVFLNCSLSNVYSLTSDGSLPVHRVGLKKGLRVAEEDLEAYLASVRRQLTVEPVARRVPKTTLVLNHLKLD